MHIGHFEPGPPRDFTLPNFQNIPVPTPEGQSLRRAFQRNFGWEILTADYSQVELAILAQHFKAKK